MVTMNPNTLKHLLNPNNGTKLLTYQERLQYISELNKICSKYRIGFSFSIGDFFPFISISNGNKSWNITDSGRAKIKTWLFQNFPDLTTNGSLHLYRFLPDFVFDSLFNSNILRMSSMAKNRKNNGPGEYEDFFKIIGMQYDKQEIDDVAANTYLMCFIDDWKEKYMWENYVKLYKGFCVEVDVCPKQKSNDFWGIRTVSYKPKSSYDFMSDMIATFKSQYQIELILPWSKFAYIYKGPKFSKEQETRIYIAEPTVCFGKDAYQSFIGQKYPKQQEIDKDDDIMYYINMPLNNDLFELQVKRVYIGGRLSKERKECMEKKLGMLNIGCEVISPSDLRLVDNRSYIEKIAAFFKRIICRIKELFG